ncbi:hypothetical protein ACFX1Q_021034 [Malus domestica]
MDESSMMGESEHVEVNGGQNPSLYSGAEVVDGYGQMLLASVGMNSTWGQMMSLISRDTSDRQKPLQERLRKLTPLMAKIGLGVAFMVFKVLVAHYFMGNAKNESEFGKFEGSKTKIDDVGNAVVDMVAVAVIVVVIAILEGFPFAVTLTLTYSMKRMIAEQDLVRRLPACETMGCTTESVEDEAFYSSNCHFLLDLIREVAFNMSGSVYRPSSGSGFEFLGPTEKAILSWATLELHMVTWRN